MDKPVEVAKRALGGDGDAMGLLIMIAPKGYDVKDEKSMAEQVVKHGGFMGPPEEDDVSEEGDGAAYEDKIQKLMDVLAPHIKDDLDLRAAAEDVCDYVGKME